MRWARVASVRAGDRSIGRAVRPVCAAGLAGCWRPGLGPPRWSSDIDGVTAWWCRMPVSRRCRLWSVSAVVGVGAWRARGRRQGPDRGRPPVAGPGHGARHRIAPVRWMRPHRRLSGHPARTRDPRPTTVVQRVGITAGPGAAGRVRRWHPARAVTGIVRGVAAATQIRRCHPSGAPPALIGWFRGQFLAALRSPNGVCAGGISGRESAARAGTRRKRSWSRHQGTVGGR